MIDRHELLATLKPIVTELEGSIRERALATPEIAEHLEQEHRNAAAAKRTAMSLEEWSEGEITQAAVAWTLGCVFVRFLEDNGLIDQPLISGPSGRRNAALGHREEHFRANPSHSDREYLEACFTDVSTFPAVASLYDRLHNPLWRLGPTADGARLLRETFTAIDPDSGALLHDFGDPQLGTRFLGDLYQDLSDAAKKRYALLQTPEFVERFILDQTLIPAIEEFGLEEVRLIDPTCGSGHFLIGAFERLFALWQDREPGTVKAVHAQRCLDCIAGVDLNPFAVAIARFRLLVTALGTCGVRRLAEAPAFRVELAVGDSLLHGSGELAGMGHTHVGVRHAYAAEDLADLERILGRGYHAVVGNPPYIAVQDAALREAYRARYASCHGKYVLTVPFMERFFELARPEAAGERGVLAGFVGKITGNNFMRREFGAPLVEKFLPLVDVQIVVDASGAYIPGHGTPTVLMFGRSRPPVVSTLRVVDGIRGEPTQPADPANGLVWSSIESLTDRPGDSNAFVRCSEIDRSELFRHPMTLGPGRGLKRQLERAAEASLGQVAAAIGVVANTGDESLFPMPDRLAGERRHVETRLLVEGSAVRDWTLSGLPAMYPYDADDAPFLSDGMRRALWPHRTSLASRKVFGAPILEKGLQWFEWGELHRDKLSGTYAIAWGEVATHNHFALHRGRMIFKQTAPVIKLDAGKSLDELLALLGVLNSSVACFWLKQVCQPKGGAGIGRGIHDEAWEMRFAFNAENVKDFPLPPCNSPALAGELDRLGAERAALFNDLTPAAGSSLAAHLRALSERDADIGKRMVSLQEELDWQTLAEYGLVSEDVVLRDHHAPALARGERACEIMLARQVADGKADTSWFERHESTPTTEPPESWPEDYRNLVQRRIDLIESDANVGLIERLEHKRRWTAARWDERQRSALTAIVLDALEDRELWSDLKLRSTSELTDWLRRDRHLVEVLELLAEGRDSDLAATVRGLVVEAAVPRLTAERLTAAGLAKRSVWERVWELQRAEDRGEEVGPISLPPRYARTDFRGAFYWKQRGKLDCPTERFVLIPGAERGADTSPVVGWAGWVDRDLARALAARITDLRQEHAADAERITPLLAGVLELLPWVHQWHPESDALFGGPPGQFFEDWLDGELSTVGVTREALRAWRPSEPTRGRKNKD